MSGMDALEMTGLGSSEAIPTDVKEPSKPAIDLLQTNNELHDKVLHYMLGKLESSERVMRTFHGRWGRAERAMQAYIKRSDDDALKNEINNSDGPIELAEIVIPYAYATVQTIVTYLMHTFCGQNPMFGVQPRSSDGVEAARMNEALLQYQIEHVKMPQILRRFFQDGEVYGLQIMRSAWKVERGMRTKYDNNPLTGNTKVRAEALVYEGNDIANIDPYMFFPDPTVEMSKVNRDGEFVFWRSFLGKHKCLGMESIGVWKGVAKAGESRSVRNIDNAQSSRGVLSDGYDVQNALSTSNVTKNQYQVDEGTIWIIPSELGIGESTSPEQYIVTILNKTRVVQLEKYQHDHAMHPVAVGEPYSMGYSFGQPSLMDYITQIQNAMSWLINSHIFNVRTVLDNVIVLDPARVDIDDFLAPKPKGPKIIRMKNTALGSDPKTAVYQLPIQDVTTQHIGDIKVLQQVGDSFSAVNDNLRGLISSGGRKTASEVRQAAEAGASRLASHAMLTSTVVQDIIVQMVLNNIQFMSEEFYVTVFGQDGVNTPMRIVPTMLVGDFHFPVNDGTLPIDRTALLDVWKELYLTASKDPNLAGSYDMRKIFEFIAKLGGIKNLEAFKIRTAPMGQDAQQVAGRGAMPVPTNAMNDVIGGVLDGFDTTANGNF